MPRGGARVAARAPRDERELGSPRPAGFPRGYPVRMAGLSRSDVEHVAHLARLGLAEEELARLEGQLNHILEQYAVLAELDTDSIAPTAQTIDLENILREDVATPSLPVDAALAGAPLRSGDYFVVPAILGDGAE
jgi:aspartyl-tRNA(Asn)/glutamyl-tRNA(Gln) amidotransferase subunit C